MNIKSLAFAVAGMFIFVGSAMAQTSVNIDVARGESHSMAYSISAYQTYEPLISGSVGELIPTTELSGHLWTPDDRDDDNVFGASLAPGLKFRMFTESNIHPFIAGSVGGIVLSDDRMGPRKLGSRVLFKTQGAAGVEFGEESQHKVQAEYTSYSNWGIAKNDDGYTTVGVSYGYSF